MPRKQRFITVLARLRRDHPDLADPSQAIRAGHVLVGGIPVTNPATLVPDHTALTLRSTAPLRGERKLTSALHMFGVTITGAVALDAGAAAGGFTRALLSGGAARVYAVDVGHGQLQGSLRQDHRVVVLERTNIADLSVALVPDRLDIITLDLSYVSLALATPQLNMLWFSPRAHLVALIKPMFELGASQLPSRDRFAEAVARAVRGVEDAGWAEVRTVPSPVLGAGGAAEFFLHARRGDRADCSVS